MCVLHAAVKRGSLADVNKLLEKFDESGSPDINGFDNQGRTPLQYAAELGHTHIAAALIEAGAEPGRRARADREGPAALHFASQNGHVDMVKLLIEGMAGFARSAHADNYSEDFTIDSTAAMFDIDGAYFETEMTPLLLACRAGHADVAMALIAAGAHVEAISGTSQSTVLHFCCSHPGPEMLPLIEIGLQRGLRDTYLRYGSTPLTIAAFHGSVDAIRAILAVRATAADLRLLCRAAEHAQVEAVKAFLEIATARNIAIPVQALENVEREIGQLQRQGATWDGDDDQSQRLRRYGRIAALLVAAGDRRWAKVPNPCRGLEAALPAVMEAAPEELPQLFERLDAPKQGRIRFILKALQRLFPIPADYFLRRAVLTDALTDDSD